MPAPARRWPGETIAEGVDGEVKFAAFTGARPPMVMPRATAGATTIHSLIYRARESSEEAQAFILPRTTRPPLGSEAHRHIDECSMVDDQRAAT